MIKSFSRPVSNLQWKIFLSNQTNRLIGQKKVFAEIEDGKHFSSHGSCCCNLYVNPAHLFYDIFLICKVRWMKKTAFKLTKTYLVYGWGT